MSILQTFLTSPTNTSIFSRSLKNHNFKFGTLTRAASQPVALFYELFIVEKLIEMDDLGLPTFQENSIWKIGVDTTKKWDLLGISPKKYGKSLGMLLLYIYHWTCHNFSTSTDPP